MLFPQDAGAGMGLGSTALFGSGGSGGLTQLQPVRRRGSETPGTASEHAAAALTVQVSAPLAVGEQTC